MDSLKSLYKVARWFVLAALIVVLVLILRVPPVPPAPAPEERQVLLQEFETKLVSLENARARGQNGVDARFSESEVNAMLANSIEQGAAQEVAAEAAASQQSSAQLKDWRVAFEGDEATAYVTTNMYGKDILVTVRGRLGASDGYATFVPTAFKIGDLSVPVSMVDPALQKKLAEPETRERLKLPDFIADLRVEDSRLVIVERAP